MRTADPPSSQACMCHSGLANTPTEPRSRLGSSATNYLNMVLKGSFQMSSTGTAENGNSSESDGLEM